MNAADVRRLALALPEAAEAPHFHFTSFRVRGRIFATMPPEGTHLHLFVPEPVREQALAMDPAFLEALPWGRRIVGLRVHLQPARAAVVRSLLAQAWRAKAPKSLLGAAAAGPAPRRG
jgi:hypothetical protein